MKTDAFEGFVRRGIAAQSAVAAVAPPMTEFDRGTRPAKGLGATCASPEPENGFCGPASPPPELLAFVRAMSLAEAGRALGLAKGTIHSLRKGYWPADPRYIVRAWGAYSAPRAGLGSCWFLRRVYPGGIVRHAGAEYTAVDLAARAGQQLAVARDHSRGLLAQTLDLPAERLVLTRVAVEG